MGLCEVSGEERAVQPPRSAHGGSNTTSTPFLLLLYKVINQRGASVELPSRCVLGATQRDGSVRQLRGSSVCLSLVPKGTAGLDDWKGPQKIQSLTLLQTERGCRGRAASVATCPPPPPRA